MSVKDTRIDKHIGRLYALFFCQCICNTNWNN